MLPYMLPYMVDTGHERRKSTSAFTINFDKLALHLRLVIGSYSETPRSYSEIPVYETQATNSIPCLCAV